MEWIAAAIVLVAVLYLYPRVVIYGGIAVAVIGAGVGGWFWWKSVRDEAESAKVVVAYAYSPNLCTPERPVHLGVINNSSRTMRAIQFDVAFRRKGYSRAVGRIDSVRQDKILKPGEFNGYCYAAPQLIPPVDPKDLDFDVPYKLITWE